MYIPGISEKNDTFYILFSLHLFKSMGAYLFIITGTRQINEFIYIERVNKVLLLHPWSTWSPLMPWATPSGGLLHSISSSSTQWLFCT